MPGAVDQIHFVGQPIRGGIFHTHRLGLDGDTFFALEVHAVEQLIAAVTPRHCTRDFEEPIRERGFAMIDVSDNTEISN